MIYSKYIKGGNEDLTKKRKRALNIYWSDSSRLPKIYQKAIILKNIVSILDSVLQILNHDVLRPGL